MRWLIDSDILIEGERGNSTFVPWLEAQTEIATADIVRCEFLLGVNAVPDAQKRQRAEQFYRERISKLASLPSEVGDYETAARVAGEARRQGQGKPGIVDGLLAAVALRTGATIATRNLTDFKAMGVPCENPLESPPSQSPA